MSATPPGIKGKTKYVPILILAICVLVGLRIWWVNENASHGPDVERYCVGDRVDLSGTYINTNAEDLDGYTLTVASAELMSPSEFVHEYVDAEQGSDYLSQGMKDDNPRSVLVVEYLISNTGDDAGGIALYLQNIVGASGNIALTYDNELWTLVYPEFKNLPGGFAIKGGTSCTVVVPFSCKTYPSYFKTYDVRPRVTLEDSSFELILSNAPVQKVVEISF